MLLNIKLKCMKKNQYIDHLGQIRMVFEGFTPEVVREALSTVSYRMVELAARGNLCAGKERPGQYADSPTPSGGDDSPHWGSVGEQAQIKRLGEIDAS